MTVMAALAHIDEESVRPSLPAAIAGAGRSAALRFLEYFAARKTRERHTRAVGAPDLRWIFILSLIFATCEALYFRVLRMMQDLHFVKHDDLS